MQTPRADNDTLPQGLQQLSGVLNARSLTIAIAIVLLQVSVLAWGLIILR